MNTAAHYQDQWDKCGSVEQMNAVFNRVIRGYSVLEDKLAEKDFLFSEIAQKIAMHRKGK